MNQLKNKLIRFMSGRYGTDKLNNFLLIVYLLLCVLNVIFFSSIISLIIDVLMLLCVILVIYRTFSRNIYKRRKENEVFLKIYNRYLPSVELIKNQWKDRKTHVYKKCPKCHSVLRLRKISGEHTARCPKCSERITVKFK